MYYFIKIPHTFIQSYKKAIKYTLLVTVTIYVVLLEE